MDGVTPRSDLKDESGHTTSRKSARIEVLVRADRRRSWTVKQKHEIVGECLASGLTLAEVARRRGISTGQLYTWRRQMVGLQSAVSTRSGPRFASVELRGAALGDDHEPAPPDASGTALPARTVGLIEILLPGGVLVRVDTQVDSRALRRVLAALGGR